MSVARGPGVRLAVIVGPTAVGKSACALLACARFGGEVVSVDSMQVYRGLDRGTSKPDPETRRRVPHHGIDLAEPGEAFSMGRFTRMAEEAIAGIAARRRLPVLVGGTGLYLRGLLKGIVEAPRRDEALRRRLKEMAGRRGERFLYRLLRRLDPEAAARVGARDHQRIIRALEVFVASRRGLFTMIRESPFGADRYRAIKVGLRMERAALYRIIDERVRRFFSDGLVEEVRGLMARGCRPESNALKALGYREVVRHLQGAIGLDDAIALTQRNTRRYAKRQWTWFRKEEGVAWFDVDPGRADCFEEPLEFIGRALAADP